MATTDDEALGGAVVSSEEVCDVDDETKDQSSRQVDEWQDTDDNAQPGAGAQGTAEESGRPARRWVIVGGAVMALCWLLVFLAIPFGSLALLIVGVVGMLPINLWWRWKYWRAGKSKTINVIRNAPTAGFGTAKQQVVDMTMAPGQMPDDPSQMRAWEQANRRYEQERRAAGGSNFSGRLFQRQFNKGCGSMVVGFVYPMRDALAEWRWSRGKGRGRRI